MDLSTNYMGLELVSPLVASASPLSRRIDSAKRLEEAGVGAIVMYSLFEEQIVYDSLALDYFMNRGTESFPESLTYLPEMDGYNIGPDIYVAHLHDLKRALQIPVIGSLNGVSPGGWVEYATLIEQAGADALELNIYNLPVDPDLSSSDLEAQYISLVQDVRAAVSIPIAVKLSPFFTALPHFAHQLGEAGANGLVLFNRFYQPDFDLEQLEVVPRLVLSNSNDLRLPLRWIALLAGRIDTDFALTGGVHTAEDVLKAMMAGANVAMMASALLKHGAPLVEQLLVNLTSWMEEYEYVSIRQMRGSLSQVAAENPGALERANYIRELSSFDELGYSGRLPSIVGR